MLSIKICIILIKYLRLTFECDVGGTNVLSVTFLADGSWQQYVEGECIL